VLKTVAKTLLALLLSIAGPLSQAQEALSPRLQIGIGILPAIIAANQRLANDDAQSLSIYLVYQNNRHRAEQLRPALEKIGKIRRHELEIESLSMTDLLQGDPAPTSAIFLVEPVGRELDELLAFTERKRVLLFSPFVGDVERGIATGFRVTDKVLPMVNMTALKQSNIQLKAFFLRVAVKHE
jgi:hypothetical protein